MTGLSEQLQSAGIHLTWVNPGFPLHLAELPCLLTAPARRAPSPGMCVCVCVCVLTKSHIKGIRTDYRMFKFLGGGRFLKPLPAHRRTSFMVIFLFPAEHVCDVHLIQTA